MIRIAAVGDIHAGRDSAGTIAPWFADVDRLADVLLLAGDLTRTGDPAEAAVLASELRHVTVPKIAVLGNHDHHDGRPEVVAEILQLGGIRTLEGEQTSVDVRGLRLGVAGVKGFAGGFPGACAPAFGEPEMKAFVRHTQQMALWLESALIELDADLRVALLHYAPVPDTLVGERLELYPLLGSYLLAEAIDRAGADLVVHGHAHAGSELGRTPGGVPVRNVAQTVLRAPYRVYALAADGTVHQPSDIAAG
jgi:Icc-related predicted phosphoesterase